MDPLKIRVNNLFRDKLTGEFMKVVDVSQTVVGMLPLSGNKLPDGWQAEPIPLTSEVLASAGLVEYDFEQHKFYHPKARRFIIEKTDAGFMFYANKVIIVEFLHRLQNLFLEFEEAELEIIL